MHKRKQTAGSLQRGLWVSREKIVNLNGNYMVLPPFFLLRVQVRHWLGPFQAQVCNPRDDYLGLLNGVFIDQSSGDYDGDFAKKLLEESFSGLW